jgi:hypothetical protein
MAAIAVIIATVLGLILSRGLRTASGLRGCTGSVTFGSGTRHHLFPSS